MYFGVATAAYQIEGAWNVDGRGACIWDTFSHTPGKIAGDQNGDVADDHYHRYAQDIQLLQSLGIKHYRFSLSWSRILPTGKVQPVNQAGVDFYNRILNLLQQANIEPLVTLYHWDLPQALMDEYNGWIDARVIDDYRDWVALAFTLFGDRVKHWSTFNEPWVFCNLGYGNGVHAPGRCSNRTLCPEGDSATEPYLCAHNILLSHAQAVHVFRQYFPPGSASISMTMNADWAEPLTTSPQDIEAADRHMQFFLGWFADPLYFGDYPLVMRQRLNGTLPVFTAEQQKMLQGSIDFFGLNHYSSFYCANNPNPGPHDAEATIGSHEKNGVPIGVQADSDWLFVVPWGVRKILNWISQRYHYPPIVITEEGVDVPNESNFPLSQALNDTFRVNYFQSYLHEVECAYFIDHVNIIGYNAWSLMDNFEWADGYSKRFGIVYVDYANDLQRHVKDSARWLVNYFNLTSSL